MKHYCIISQSISALTFAFIEDAYTAVSAIEDFVAAQNWIRVGLNPDTSHRIIKYLIVLQNAQAVIIHEYSAILTAPNAVAHNPRIAARPAAIFTRGDENRVNEILTSLTSNNNNKLIVTLLLASVTLRRK